MKKTLFKKSALGLFFAGFIAAGFSSAAYSSDSSSVVSDAVDVDSDASSSATEPDESKLTPADIAYINKKKAALSRYLYEQNQLEELTGMIKEDVRETKVSDEKRKSFPMNPEEIADWRSTEREVKKAANAPIAGPVEFKIKTIDIDVDAPAPIQILVAKGYSSSIMFFDQTGAPWPIEGDIIGDKQSFDSKPFNGKPHVGVFEIKKEFSESNALINLKDMNVPIVVRLTGSESEIDSRISVRIPKFGPGAQLTPYVRSEIENSNPDMLSVLNGDKLAGAKLFELSGVPGTVWYKDGRLYVRTLATLMSPPWKTAMTSPTGYNVYELPPVVNLLFSHEGRMMDATISNSVEVKITQEQSIFKQSNNE